MLSPSSILQNRYQIIRQLGAGGMGAVYLALHTGLNQYVALKENTSTDPSANTQFQAEAKILARLSHPNLPRVMDFFIEPNGARFLVMEYVEGQNLQQWIIQGSALSEKDALAWMAQVFGAVRYLHASGIVHRDCKPQNIIITPQGKAMLVDFGIAKVIASGQATLTGARAGSPGYAPPEQYGGGTDARSDVYSLCATLYALLTGRVPPDAQSLKSGSALLVPPRRLNAAISTQTENAILRGMEMEPGQRFQTVAELEHALAKTVASASWRMPSSVYQTARSGSMVPVPSARNPLVAILPALLGGLGLLGVLGIGALLVISILGAPAATPTHIAGAGLVATPVNPETPNPSAIPSAVALPSAAPKIIPTTPAPTFTPPASPTLTNTPGPVTTFLEDFAGSSLDPSRWVRENVGGNTAEVSGGALRMSSSGPSYPYIYTRNNPFPTTGDFRLTVRYRYSSIGVCGATISAISAFLPVHKEGTVPFIPYEGNLKISFFFWPDKFWFDAPSPRQTISLPGGHTSLHELIVEYHSGRYTVSQDGNKVFMSDPIQGRPHYVAIGNSSVQGNTCPWDVLEINRVQVETLP